MLRTMRAAVAVGMVVLFAAAIQRALADPVDQSAFAVPAGGPGVISGPAAAPAGPVTPRGPLQRLFGPHGQKDHFVGAPPGSWFHPQAVPGPTPAGAGSMPVPAFNWGYFGARSHCEANSHRTYVGEATTWFWPGR